MRPRYDQCVAIDGKIGTWRDDMHTIGGKDHAILGFDNRQCDIGTQQIDQQAWMVRVQVLHKNKCEPAVNRHYCQ
ncbi:hypothetical protein GCM10007973_30990 [Polymorphobacter multimanifer]|nr:hypothetical protein GCM10007973_30990 [Polymorphobacter multimanifer]